jgi:hypothetical protein
MEALKHHQLTLSFDHTKSVWLLINKLLLFVPPAVLIYLFFTLVLNSWRGFDITDESFYLLWASQPEHVMASTTQFGHYTGLLYLLSGKNIALFRITGILMLLGTTGFFSVALQNYWATASEKVLSVGQRWKIITLTLISALAYYRSWLLTPCYSWLALLSALIVGTGLLRATTKNSHNQLDNRQTTGTIAIVNGLIVGIGGGLAFMAKPTTALILAMAAVFWMGVHCRRHKLQLFFLAALGTSGLFLLMHAVVFKGGIFSFYFELRDGVEFAKMLGKGHSIGSLSWQAVEEFKQIPERVFRLTPVGFMLFPLFLGLVWWLKRRGQETIAIYGYSIFLVIFNSFVWYRLWEAGKWSRAGFGFGGITLSLVLMASALLTLCVLRNSASESGLETFKRLLATYVFLFMLAFAQTFGTASPVVRQISCAYVFLATGALYTALWIDNFVDRLILGNIVPVLLSVSVLMTLMLAFKHPYRLPASIDKQLVKSSFLLGQGSLHVDTPTASYINQLKKVALEAGWVPGTPLIDLTGGSPGASVILGGRIMGLPWFLGGYKGSNDVAVNALKMVPGPLQSIAWVLTAPDGKRRLSNQILSEIDLNFPGGYMAVGKVRTGHRNERQILWRPLDTRQSFVGSQN